MADQVQAKLDKNHFDNVIRMVKRADIDKIEVFEEMLKAHVERLKITVNPKNAAKGIPAGSDSSDLMSLNVWMAKVTRKNRAACRQIAVFAATVQARLDG